MTDHQQRPLERRILRQVAAGDDVSEIARRLNRSPEFVQRVIDYADIERETHEPAAGEVLNPLERRVLRLRAEGVDYDDLGAKFHRSAGHVERVEQLANVKLDQAKKS
jgi:hypothetical protein